VVARFTGATRVDQAELRALDATGNVIDERAVSELRWAAENPGGSS
jgi:hypothetical protein